MGVDADRTSNIDSTAMQHKGIIAEKAATASTRTTRRGRENVGEHEQREVVGNLELGILALPGGLLDGSQRRRMSRGEDEEEDVGKDQGRLTLDEDAVEKQIAVAVDQVTEFPDGGPRAWSVVLGAWCISFISWGSTNSFGVFQDYYTKHILSDKSPDTIAWIGAMQIFLILFGGIFVGRLFDAGFTKSLVAVATVIAAAGWFTLPYCTTYPQVFLAQGLACGLAPGIAFTPSVSLISHYFRRRRSFVLGIFATGASAGGIIYPIMLNNLLNNSRVGFAWSVRAAGFLTVFMMLVALVTLKQRLPPRKGHSHFLDWRVFKDPAYTFIVAGASIVMMGLYTPMIYLQTYARKEQLDDTLIYYSLAILSGASIFGRLIPNYLGDGYGPINVLGFNSVLSSILIFCWLPLGKSNGGLIAFCIIFGFVSGTQVSMAPACIASITKPTELNTIGIRMSMMYLIIAFLALPGPSISGALIDATGGSYVAAACLSGGLVGIGAACYMTSRMIVAKRKGSKWV